VDIPADTGTGPHFVVTNLCEQPLTAFFLQKSAPEDGKVEGGVLWDALTLGQSPIAKGGTVSPPLGHVEGQPFTDKIEVVAAVWADGSTFGNPARLKLIISNRTAELRSYDRAISLLQKGIQQNWTRDEYLAAWDEQKKAGPLTGAAAAIMESNLQRNPSLDSTSKLQRTIQRFLDMFFQRRDILRQSKPELSAVGNPN
jgi:hypothetical protein